MTKPLLRLRPAQMRAADPRDNAWVSASAGTGKTQVLTARVLRLLLGGAAPERILCLTFTKAAAAEMQERIFARLTRWVRASDAELDVDLDALGEPSTAEVRERARRLFALVVDARGGLRIQTFHSFAQSLLAGFPIEAGVAPGFSVLDDRTGVELRARVLTDALADEGFAADVAGLAVRLGERKFASVAAAMLRHREGLRALGAPAGHPALLRRRLGLPTDGERDGVLAEAVADGRFDTAGLQGFARACAAWGTATGLKHADVMAAWIGAGPVERVARFAELREVFHTKTGEPRKLSPKLVEVADLYERLCDGIAAVAELDAKFALVEVAATHLRVGHVLEAGFRIQKARAGLLDFDDMIARVAAMLAENRMAEWVRFKLDQAIDHILVDEGQDTNAAQWEIARVIAEEFFAGAGARGETHRTLFAVGDYKQSIFSFQGSDPRVFDIYREHFSSLATDAGAQFHDVPLAESFRSGPAVLEVVDRVIDDLGADALGLERLPEPHRVGRPGDPASRVVLWPPIAPDAVADDDAEVAADGDEAGWLPGPVLRLAARIAAQVRAWIDDPDMRLADGRRVQPQDVLVLVRARGEFVGALVANLHAQRVPVAGVDRLRLTAPIAVQDCLALVRFALQPDDDLTLATLLVSPFLGWSQEALFELAHDRGTRSLWRRLRAHAETDEGARSAFAWLGEVLALADLKPPHEFLETILSGPLGGRARLLARLGEEARDQIEALLAQALSFEGAHAPSLQGFLAWIENDEFDLKRDPDAPADAVRIMTVHGAKGLQAPIVILADAARKPNETAPDHIALDWGPAGEPIPIFYGGKVGRIGAVADRIDHDRRRAEEEHWRLLYVALTRAEDMLFVGGALGAHETVPHPDSWHARVGTALGGLGATTADDPLWGEATTYAAGVQAPPREAEAGEADMIADVPDWARAAPAPEPAPPRPLSPSQLAEDDVASPPPSTAMIEAARKGTLLHKLFERLPAVAAEERLTAAQRWLARQARDLDEAARDELAYKALAVIDDPDFAELFGPDALAEAPVAAVVGTAVIAGKVDRLLIQPDRVQIVDFKTGLRVPATADEVSAYHLKQMAAYAAALRRIFPGRAVEAALLFTEVARLIPLPGDLLAAHEPKA